jgi:CRP-like cAMP-binding protein
MRSNPSLLDALDAPARARLLERGVTRTLARGETLCLAGDRAHRAHVLLAGIVKMVARGLEGQTTIVWLARPEELLGEISLLDEEPQPLDLVAATRCVVLGVEGSVLSDALRASPAASLVVARTLARRFRWLCGSALERSTGTVPARLAGRLLDLAELLGSLQGSTIELELPLAQEELGGLAGMCRESACKALRTFKSEGLLDYRGRRLRILRPDALDRIRCAGRSR